MSDYQCQICTGTRGWHTIGCKQVSQELAALRQRIAELEAKLEEVELNEARLLNDGSAEVADMRDVIDEQREEIASLKALHNNTPNVSVQKATTPTLELVGGEWGISANGEVAVRDIGDWTMWIRYRDNVFAWNIEEGCETCDAWIAQGTAPTREAAIETAEKALLSEVTKFVRIKS